MSVVLNEQALQVLGVLRERQARRLLLPGRGWPVGGRRLACAICLPLGVAAPWLLHPLLPLLL